jgi:hypothetical protein
MNEQAISVATRFRFCGYHQTGCTREFCFEDTSPSRSAHRLSLSVDTALLSKYQVYLQATPQLCLKGIAISSGADVNREAGQLNLTISETDFALLAPKDEPKPRFGSRKPHQPMRCAHRDRRNRG